MKNWKTTVSGIITAAAGFVLFSPDLFVHYHWAVELAKYLTLGGGLSLAFFAKDGTTTSTQGEVDQSTLAATTARIESLKK